MPDRRRAVAELLARFAPADPLERAHLDEIRRLVATDGDWLARDHFAPGHLTASSFVVSPDRAQLLLIFHHKLQKWLQPGGHVDAADTDILAAARREVAEETGLAELDLLAAPFDVDVHAIPPWKSAPPHCHFDVRFLFAARSWQIAAGDDAAAARWCPLDQVGQLQTDESVMRATRKILSLDLAAL